ncbi:MAG: hypothetical protein HN929_11010, partial [Chloroflexi bacterium]|nr:hypothetical protein [Candidatus Neomarinimicrobiota bacterium]MBT7081969.1 hypothetical protein [Chloroflexota bacterium]
QMIACAGSLWATENSISKRCGSRVKITFLLKNPVKGYFPLTPLNSYLKRSLNERIAQQMIGVQASITMGKLRSIRVFILGDVQQPGSYMVSALSTMTNALFVSGGITKIGSLRNVQLKRRGEVVTTLDLYDLLLRGDTSQDTRVQPGDVIFVPTVQKMVGVSGAVYRPALYEVKGEKSVQELLQLAGGLLPTAYKLSSQIERIGGNGKRSLQNINLQKKLGLGQAVQAGDVIHVDAVLERMERVVHLKGEVQRPGARQWSQGMRLSDLIEDEYNLLEAADVQYCIVIHEPKMGEKTAVESANLASVIRNTQSKENIELHPRDQIIILPVHEDRAKILDEVVDTIYSESRFGEMANVVKVTGHVRFEGGYPFEEGMDVKALLSASLGLLPGADANYALIRRVSGIERHIEVLPVSLKDENGLQQRLKPEDELIILKHGERRMEPVEILVLELKEQATREHNAPVVEVTGMVKFPGQYPLSPGMTVKELLQAAGGMREEAYSASAELIKREVLDGGYRETSHKVIALSSKNSTLESGSTELHSFDLVHIRPIPLWQESRVVTLEGEVTFPGSYVLSRSETLTQLLERAGGATSEAFLEGAVFSRDAIRKREKRQFLDAADQMERELLSSAVSGADESKMESGELAAAKQLIQKLRDTEVLGRLSIPLQGIMQGVEADVPLMGGDKLILPRKTDTVTVVGEVFLPSSHMYREGMNVDDYIQSSGGETGKADLDKVYVIKANGIAISPDGGGSLMGKTRESWFGVQALSSEDTIVVPLAVGEESFWTKVSGISETLYQLSLTIAALSSVGAL